MAGKNGADTQQQILEALHQLHATQLETNTRLEGITVAVNRTNERVDIVAGEIVRTNVRLDALTDEMKRMNGRFDHFLETAGEDSRKQNERISRIEARLESVESRVNH